jgi:hypothetical protein
MTVGPIARLAMMLSVLVMVADRGGVVVVGDGNVDPADRAGIVQGFAELLVDEPEAGRLAGWIALLRSGRNGKLHRAAADDKVEQQRLGVDGHGVFGGAIEKIERNRVTGVVVNQLGVILFFAQFDQLAVVRTFFGMRGVDMAMFAVVLLSMSRFIVVIAAGERSANGNAEQRVK